MQQRRFLQHPPAQDGRHAEVAPPEAWVIEAEGHPREADYRVQRFRRTPHPVYWVIAAALVAIAVSLLVRPGDPLLSQIALGQPVASGGARGVFAFSGQLSKHAYGVYLVDVDAMTMWTYEYLPQKGCLRLAAARTWRYDRYLENHNVCDLPPEIVEQMVEEQRQYRRESTESQLP